MGKESWITQSLIPLKIFILTDGKNGIVVPYGDICRFAEKMQELMNDSELRERLARQGIQSSLQFSRGIVIDRWENLFISLIK